MTRVAATAVVFAIPALVSGFAFAQSAPADSQPAALSIDTLMATPFPTDLVAAPTGAHRVGVEQQRRAQRAGRRPGARDRGVARPDRSQVARRHQLHGRRRAVDHRARLDQRREDDRLRARRRRQPPGRIAQSRAAAGRHRPSRVRGGRSTAARQAPRRGQRSRAVTPRPARRVGVARTDLERRSRAPTDKPAQLVNARGSASGLSWSPDGSMLAFTSGRGTHSYIGVFTLASRELRYIDPSLDRDGNPVWSPDGSRIAWIRQGAAPRARMFSPRREVDEPWSIRVADVKTGQARQVWKADAGYGSAFQGVGRRQPAVLGRRRSPGVPVGERRLAASLFRAGQRRHRHAADAGRLRSRVRQHHARSIAR